MSDDPVIALAIKQRDCLLDCAKEFRIHGNMAKTVSAKKLAEFDAAVCEDAAKMLEKLGTEISRLRLAIQHFDHGRMGRFELRDVVKNWNGQSPGHAPEKERT